MQTLFFVKFEGTQKEFNVGQQVVFLQTASNPTQAEWFARMGIVEEYRAMFRTVEVTPVCATHDTVNLFEPC